MYINMLQEEGYWSCPPDHHVQSDHHRLVQVHGYNNPILIKFIDLNSSTLVT